MELAINSLPNKSTGFSPFYLNYGHEPILSIQLIKGDEEIRTESIGSFVRRVTSDWELAQENLQRAVGLQQKYYNRKHRDVQFAVGDLVLLSTRNLKMRGIPEKLKNALWDLSRSKNELDDKHTDCCCLRHGRSTRCSIFPF